MANEHIERVVEEAQNRIKEAAESAASRIDSVRAVVADAETKLRSLAALAKDLTDPTLQKFGPIFVGQMDFVTHHSDGGITGLGVNFNRDFGGGLRVECASFLEKTAPKLTGKYRVVVMLQKVD